MQCLRFRVAGLHFKTTTTARYFTAVAGIVDDGGAENGEQRGARIAGGRVSCCRGIAYRRVGPGPPLTPARGVDLGRQHARQQREGEEAPPRADQAPARLSRNSVNSRTPIAVGPFAWLTPSQNGASVPTL